MKELKTKYLNAILQNIQVSPTFHSHSFYSAELVDILFLLEEWAHFNKHLTSRFTDTHLLYLMILFATGHMGSVTGEPVIYVDWVRRFMFCVCTFVSD